MSHLRTVETATVTTIDEEGTVLDVETKRKRIVVHSAEQYFATFSKIVGVLKDLNGSDVKVMTYIIMNAPIGSNFVCIGKAYKEQIAKEIGIAEETVRKSLLSLANNKILIRNKEHQRSGCYHINPEYYWKGDMAGRNSAMKWLLELNYLP
jgi:predicted transcriptional regulator